jgi:5-methylcytosine-specific restriction endonuclease McrA
MANQFERKEIYQPHEILDFLPDRSERGFDKTKRDYDGDMMKMASDRYYTFAKALHCAHCGIIGKFFAKERHVDKNNKPLSVGFHFNLYAIDKNGEDVLMTKDHILPRSKQGRNNLSNYQTMCEPCNSIKKSTSEKKALKNAKKRLKET